MFTVVTLAASGSIIVRSKKLYRLQLQSGGHIRSEDSFWQAAFDSLPLDPPMSAPVRSLDAAQDSLFGGLLGEPDGEVDVLWAYADQVPRDVLRFGVAMIQTIADWLHPTQRAEYGDPGGVKLQLYLVCANELAADDLVRTMSALS